MIAVGLDLSLHSTGYAIANTDTSSLQVGRICSYDYAVSAAKNKYVKMSEDALSIAKLLLYKLLPYRNLDIAIVIEEVAFGYAFRPGSTNSTYQLLFEGATVAAILKQFLNCKIDFVPASKHKKLFTGNGKAKKEDSIRQMLSLWPQLQQCADKLDDIADALSIVSTAVPLSTLQLEQCQS